MRPRQTKGRLVTIVLGLLAIVASPALLGDDQPRPTATEKQDPSQPMDAALPHASEQLLGELTKLREEVGDSVLAGTILEPTRTESEEGFARGVQKLLGVPQHTVKTQKQVSVTTPEMVKTLRRQCVTLDRIAGELEQLRQYQHADELRDAARQLRLIARRLDQ